MNRQNRNLLKYNLIQSSLQYKYTFFVVSPPMQNLLEGMYNNPYMIVLIFYQYTGREGNLDCKLSLINKFSHSLSVKSFCTCIKVLLVGLK